MPKRTSIDCGGADAYLGAAALELADLLGHDQQSHRVHRALWPEQSRSVDDLPRVLDGDLGLYYLCMRPGRW
ncbi:hypothetical protein ACWCPX_21320 [Streptomyces olivaceoviridis]